MTNGRLRKMICLDCALTGYSYDDTATGICPRCKKTHYNFESVVNSNTELRQRIKDIRKGIPVSDLDAETERDKILESIRKSKL